MAGADIVDPNHGVPFSSVSWCQLVMMQHYIIDMMMSI